MDYFRKVSHIVFRTFTSVILYLTDGFLIAAATLLGPIFAVYVEHIGGTIIDAGLAFAIFSLTAGIGVLIFSRVENKVKHYAIFVTVGYLLAAFAYTLYIFITNPFQLFFAQFILGIAAAVRLPAYETLISGKSPHIAVAWGNWNATVYLVSAFSAITGATIASVFGFTSMLVLIAFLALVSLVLSLAIIKFRVSDNAPNNNFTP